MNDRLSLALSVLGGIILAVVVFGVIIVTTDGGSAATTTRVATTAATTTTIAEATTSSVASTTSSQAATTTVPASTTVGFAGDTSTKSNATTEGDPGPTLTEVRVGDHTGFVRIVFEFTGSGTPSYEVGYAAPPFVGGGSGEEVPVLGSAYLKVRVMPGSRFDPATGDLVYTGDATIDPALDPIVEVQFVDDFEADMVWVVGLMAERPFTVRVLQGPLRLVVDIAK